MAAHLGAWAYSTGRYLCMFYAGEFEMYVSHALTAAWLRACMLYCMLYYILLYSALQAPL